MGKEQKSTALATQQCGALIGADIMAMFDMKAQMEGVEPRLPQIGIVHQGQMWKMPNESKVESFIGVILDHNRANAWWEQSFDESGGNTPPDCFSLDGLTPDPSSPKKKCANCMVCPMNAFGSDGGRGKACKNMKRVHILVEGDDIPHRLTLPPSNLKAFDDYITNLSGKRLPMQLVKTEFRLREEKNKDGIAYSEVDLMPVMVDGKPELVAAQDALMTVANAMVEMVESWRDAMRGQAFHAEEMSGAPQPDPYAPVYTGPADDVAPDDDWSGDPGPGPDEW